MLKPLQYDLTLRKLFDLICKMTPEERGLLLREAERIRTKLRATRRNCHLSVFLHYGKEIHSATVTDLSFTGAFVECLVPVMIGDLVAVEFKNGDEAEKLMLKARIMHATSLGIGVRFITVRSKAARFLQKCLDDFK